MSDTESLEDIDTVIREAMEVEDPADRERRLNYLLDRRLRAMQRPSDE